MLLFIIELEAKLDKQPMPGYFSRRSGSNNIPNGVSGIFPGKPILELPDTRLAYQDFLLHRDFQVHRQASVKPEVDVGYGFPGDKILAVHTEENIRVQAVGQLIERLRKSIFPPIGNDRLHKPVVDIEEQNHIYRQRKQLVPLYRNQEMRLVVLLPFQHMNQAAVIKFL